MRIDEDNTASLSQIKARLQNLPRQEEIMAGWPVDQKAILGIACITYNHRKYIEDALSGFLTQKTHFRFEIVIHDDASTDGTADVLRYYQKEYPNLIRLILQKENQHSKGKGMISLICKDMQDKYIAFCEGDDYWTDPYKLQTQVEALDNNPLIDMAIHPALVINETNGTESKHGVFRAESGIIPASEIFNKEFSVIPTASTVVRKSVCDRFINFREKNSFLTVGDIYLQLLGADSGAVWYSSVLSGVYRQFADGSWSNMKAESDTLKAKHLLSLMKGYNAIRGELSEDLQKFTDYRQKICLFRFSLLYKISAIEKLRTVSIYHSFLSLSEKIIVFSLCVMPSFLLTFFASIGRQVRKIKN